MTMIAKIATEITSAKASQGAKIAQNFQMKITKSAEMTKRATNLAKIATKLVEMTRIGRNS